MITESTAAQNASSTPITTNPPRATAKPWLARANAVTGLVVLTVLFSLPVIWMIVTSLKQESEYTAYPIVILPAAPQFLNYQLAVTIFPYLTFFMHSVILSGSYTVLTVLTSAAAGFGFSRHRGVPGRDALFGVVLSTMMLPGLVTLVPQYMLFAKLGLLNSYWPWILWGLSASPFHIFLFRQFFASIPRELEDAAEVDGSSKFRVFWQIFLPNSLPAVAASAIFAFTWVWGDWLYPELFLSDSITTLAVKLATSYVNPQGIPLMTVTMAGVILYVIPMIVIFFVAQKYIIQGVVTTGLKG
ncbi:MAG TPA: carbohydrate ABC transporter permease [Chloroflexota bacterium]|nr:carbohydrate ABC transporter permease [Chloroflexota bacterium]